MLSEEDREEGFVVSRRLFGLLVVGFVLMFVGVAVVFLAAVFSGSSSVGGVILIGPIPIVFGSGPDAVPLVLLGVIITVISVVLFLIMNRRAKTETTI
jgi:uncharacterized membrane protein